MVAVCPTSGLLLILEKDMQDERNLWSRICAEWVFESSREIHYRKWVQMVNGREGNMAMGQLGISPDDKCAMCGDHEETVQHIFFECNFSKKCLKATLEWIGTGVQHIDIQGIWKRVARSIQGRRCRGIATATLATLVYWIWKAQNKAVWDLKVPTIEGWMRQLKQECKMRKSWLMGKKMSQKERSWIDRLLT
ncbi:uncharacterized protein LOC132609537 [Lycium barbarum]|uniref:uncharacterized protein LOC132609537 n=1 Tax=Lycium barbarum TaxID=112863 RepID=UPI00293F60A6|nr:uncharacterized protein LOC132609537 [Lycium barbarum]